MLVQIVSATMGSVFALSLLAMYRQVQNLR